MKPLVDPFGRTVRDLRISITDRCNFRCTYCMPEEGMKWLPREDLLTYEELTRVASVCVERFGLESIRITGGEPMVRAHLPVLIRRLADLGVDLAMTTNGSNLGHQARRPGSRGSPAHQHRATRFVRTASPPITGRDSLPQVLEGIDAAVAAGLNPVKVNCVLVRGVNDDEMIDFAEFGRERGVEVRFIEWMPLDGGGSWAADRVVPASEVMSAVDAVWPLVTEDGRRVSQASPAESYRYADGRGRVGVIASVTRAFCESCDRIRLTAEGQLRNCLFSVRETDLRHILRSGGSDDDLAVAIEAEVGRKWAGHSIGQVNFIRPARSMSQIGG